MEGEIFEPEQQPRPEQEASPFMRVEFDGEHKIFIKACAECGHEFSTSVPRKYFRYPDDESTTLRINGGGAIDGYSSIQGEDIENHIFNRTCADIARNSSATKSA